MSIKLDLHVHSESRGRVFIDAEELRSSLKFNNLDGVAITNFFSISHALRLKDEVKEYVVIVGQEIYTKDGHILALGLKERIADFQSAQDTIGCIHEQGGLAVAAHPFLPLGVGRKAMSLDIDAVEVHNGLMGIFFIQNLLAKMAAEKMNIPQLASTDTTDPKFIGTSYTKVMTEDRGSILETIRNGNIKLFKKALPLPLGFFLKNIFKFRNVEPCSIHAVPCFICGKSMTIRLFKEKFICLDCGRAEFSRIACCNGHYICKECLIKRG